ncbi:unnamed protein product, partial [Prorocentrum cordatum]
IDAAAARVARRACPSTVHLGDASAAGPRDLAKRLRRRGRISRAWVMGGFPFQAPAALKVDRQGLAGARAGLVQHLKRIADGLAKQLPEPRIDFLGENVASTMELDAMVLIGCFERIPDLIEAGAISWAKRPRPRTAGITERSETELERWAEAGHAAPPHQHGKVAPPPASVREQLAGFAEGRVHREVVAWLASHWAAAAGLLVAAPSLAELRESARAWAGGRRLRARGLASLRRGREALQPWHLDELDLLGGPAHVGRGSQSLGAPSSTWGNPFRAAKGRAREEAAALCASWLRRNR